MNVLILLTSLWFLLGQLNPPEIIALTSATSDAPQFRIIDFSDELKKKMLQTTWRQGCPTPVEDLRLLRLSYWDFTGISRAGLLIVDKAVASEVVNVFHLLYIHGFLIERMKPVEEYGGSDNLSMAANNTSAFNCRDVAGKPGRFSNHSWGRAIDINPLVNPMLLNGKVLPPQGAVYVDRSKTAPGSILDHSFIVETFKKLGWTWGGEWMDPDYQHFEKPHPNRK